MTVHRAEVSARILQDIWECEDTALAGINAAVILETTPAAATAKSSTVNHF